MNIIRSSTIAGAFAALLLLNACSTSDILGGGSSGNTMPSKLRGTVDSVDSRSRSIMLTNVGSYLNSGQDSARVYYDDRTTVQYQGRSYRPEDLERGDQIDAMIDQSNGMALATKIEVVYNAAGSTSPGGTGTYGSSVTGTVQYVDSGRRTLTIDRGTYGGATTVQYDTSTSVLYNGRSYRPEDLERGDEVTVTVRTLGNGAVHADRIDVTRSVSGGTSSSSGQPTIRGTVSYVDTARRTIELQQTSWTSRFNPGTGTGTSGTSVVQYDSSTVVVYEGQNQSPTGLERGDVVDVEVRDMGKGNYLAQRIYLVRDVRR